jgi:hypothetical protein
MEPQGTAPPHVARLRTEQEHGKTEGQEAQSSDPRTDERLRAGLARRLRDSVVAGGHERRSDTERNGGQADKRDDREGRR